MPPRIGLDFGGVIVRSRASIEGEDTRLAEGEGAEVALPGAFEGVRELVAMCGGEVWIVSKAWPRMQARTLAWLDAAAFHERTGLDRGHVRFCLERADKAGICRELGITHFVDDQMEVLEALRGTVPHLYRFGEPGEGADPPPWATCVSEWPELVRSLERAVAYRRS